MTGGRGPLAGSGGRGPTDRTATRALMALGLALVLLAAGCQVGAGPPTAAPTPAPVPTVTTAPAPTVPAPTPTSRPATTAPLSPTVVATVAVAATPGAPSPTARVASPPVFQFPPTPVPPTPYAGASVGLGQPFALKIGQGVTVQGADLRLEFRAVTEDSRCPASVNCVWSGRAVVTLAATGAARPATALTIATCCPFDKANHVPVGGHDIEMRRVYPAPLHHEVKIRPEEYVIELVVTRSGA